MRKNVFIVCVVLFSSLAASAAFDLGGSWELPTVTPRGERVSTVVFVQEGERLTVTVKRPGRDGRLVEMTSEGTFKGETIEWKETRRGPEGREMTVAYKGTVAADGSLKGTMEFSGGRGFAGGEGAPPVFEWKAVRKAS